MRFESRRGQNEGVCELQARPSILIPPGNSDYIGVSTGPAHQDLVHPSS